MDESKNPVELAARIGVLERTLREKIDKMPRAGDICNCSDCTTYDFVHYGNISLEVEHVCCSCGGYVEIRLE